jgi:mRNA-degrading endonuclease toxin of MazEF toxin-antitoxin module
VAAREFVMAVPQQGDVYAVFVGGQPHFVVVVSEEQFNRGDYVVAVLITSQHFERRSRLPNCVPFKAGSFCFTENCVAQAESIAQIERSELMEHKATLDGESLRNVI